MQRSGTDGCYNVNPKKNLAAFSSNFTVASSQLMKPSQSLKADVSNCCEKKSVCTTGAAGKMLIDGYLELKEHPDKELKLTTAGWKRDGNGNWYKDENMARRPTSSSATIADTAETSTRPPTPVVTPTMSAGQITDVFAALRAMTEAMQQNQQAPPSQGAPKGHV